MHDGKYVFDGRKIRKAHEWNYNRFLQAVHNDYELIIVDNTHTQFWEMISYLETGLDFGYEIQFLEPNTPWAKDVDQLLEKNTHGVPRASIERMLKRWEPTPEILKGCEEKFECQVNWKTNTIWLDHN